jgi:hypothetical protein
MNRQPLASPAEEHLAWRRFLGEADFEILAQIHNDAARKHYGDRMTPVGAGLLKSLLSAKDV